jgi:hypothetical protein
MKFGRIKRQHGRIQGLDDVLNRIIDECDAIDRIIPGRISKRKSNFDSEKIQLQYSTLSGLKCIYYSKGCVQEVFVVCNDEREAVDWLGRSGLLRGDAPPMDSQGS